MEEKTLRNVIKDISWVACCFLVGITWGCVVDKPHGQQPGAQEKCDVAIQTVRLTAGGRFLDVRYRVLDSRGARIFVDPSVPASLLHEPTGKELFVASSKLGRLRQYTSEPETGREYFMLFGNPGGIAMRGDRVTLVVGPCRMEGLEVE